MVFACYVNYSRLFGSPEKSQKHAKHYEQLIHLRPSNAGFRRHEQQEATLAFEKNLSHIT